MTKIMTELKKTDPDALHQLLELARSADEIADRAEEVELRFALMDEQMESEGTTELHALASAMASVNREFLNNLNGRLSHHYPLWAVEHRHLDKMAA